MIKCRVTRFDEIDCKIPEICYSFQDSPFGKCLIGVIENKDNENAICHLSFIINNAIDDTAVHQMKVKFSGAHLVEKEKDAKQLIKTIFDNDIIQQNLSTIPIVLKGTEFQIKVWQALIDIPMGTLLTYQQVAEMINKPTAVRAVAGAIKANQIGYLIPCHRVVCKNGTNKFGWGVERKLKMQEFEKQIFQSLNKSV